MKTDIYRFSNPAAARVAPAALARETLGAEAQVTRFLSNHQKIRKKIDAEGKKGLCSINEDLAKAGVNVSDPEMALHRKVFNLHNYTVAPLPDVLCNRDTLREMAERLSTSTK